MYKRHCICVIFITLIINSISCSRQNDVDRYLQKEKELYNIYLNGNIKEAKKSMEEYLSFVLDYQRRGIRGIHYPTAIGATCIRLYMIEDQLGNSDKAVKYLDKALKIQLIEMKAKMPEEKIDIEKEKSKLINFYKGIDIKNSVKWMNNLERHKLEKGTSVKWDVRNSLL